MLQNVSKLISNATDSENRHAQFLSDKCFIDKIFVFVSGFAEHDQLSVKFVNRVHGRASKNERSAIF